MKYLISVAFTLISICSSIAVAQGTDTQVDTLEISIEEGLDLVLRGAVPHATGPLLILRAGASRDPVYIPLLQQVVDSWAPGGANNSRIFRSFEMHTAAALHSLWLIGESEAYFLANLRNWDEDYMLAHQSALVLARTPTPEFLEELERICETSDNPNGSNYLWGDLSQARHVADKMEAYENMANERARADHVVNYIAGWWSPEREDYWINPTGSGWTEIRYTNPISVVFWGWFRALSRDHPGTLANTIRDIPVQLGRTTLTLQERERLQTWLTYMAAL